MDIKITEVILSKEITWNEVKERDALFTDMMRNRATIKAVVAMSEGDTNSDKMWDKFSKDVRKFCDSKNVGLYCIRTTSESLCDGRKVTYYPNGFMREVPNGACGEFTIYFEDPGDYARFVKDRAVNFKLSINTQ